MGGGSSWAREPESTTAKIIIREIRGHPPVVCVLLRNNHDRNFLDGNLDRSGAHHALTICQMLCHASGGVHIDHR